MNKKYIDNLPESSSETETVCPSPKLTSLSPLENIFISSFFFLLLSQTVQIFLSKKIFPALSYFFPFTTLSSSPLPKMKTSPASLHLLSISCLEKVPSQPPPWRGGGVLGHVSMHAARLKKSAPYSSQMLPTLQSGKKKKSRQKCPKPGPKGGCTII